MSVFSTNIIYLYQLSSLVQQPDLFTFNNIILKKIFIFLYTNNIQYQINHIGRY